MDNLLQAISSVGFPIVMCGALMYYIYKVETELIASINANTTQIALLVAQFNTEEVDVDDE